jgi:hypothetical protein
MVWFACHGVVDVARWEPKVTAVTSRTQSPIALAWNALHSPLVMPYSLELLAKFDIWDTQSDPNVLPFQYGMRSRPNGPKAPVWDAILASSEEAVQAVVADGLVIMAYEELRDQRLMKVVPHEVVVAGLRIIAANVWTTTRMTFASVWDPEKYDAILAYQWIGSEGVWRVSVFSDKPGVRLDQVAKILGTEAHAHSVVGYVSELPFEKASP